MLITGDFNAITAKWWRNDTTTIGTKIDSLSTSYSVSQIISDPNYILPISSSFLDLTFTNQANIVIENGVHLSLHPACHHHAVLAKINLRSEYLPLYERLIWGYKNANVQ